MEEKNVKRVFYESTGNDIPYQKEFFEYHPTVSFDKELPVPSLLLWEIYEKLSYPDVLLWDEERTSINMVSSLIKSIPFVEQAYLAWSLSFWNSTWPVDIVVVSNTKRVWFVKILLEVLLWAINVFQKNRWLLLFRLVLVTDRVRSDCSWMKKGIWDLMSAYWIWHLVVIYEQYNHWWDQFFSSNAWIRYAIPNHPLRSCINLWVQTRQWMWRVRKILEWWFSWIVWDWLDAVFFAGYLMFKKVWYRYEKVRRVAPYAWWDSLQSDRALLRRKVFSKTKRDS